MCLALAELKRVLPLTLGRRNLNSMPMTSQNGLCSFNACCSNPFVPPATILSVLPTRSTQLDKIISITLSKSRSGPGHVHGRIFGRAIMKFEAKIRIDVDWIL
jgi:hypothetical protein